MRLIYEVKLRDLIQTLGPSVNPTVYLKVRADSFHHALCSGKMKVIVAIENFLIDPDYPVETRMQNKN